MKASDNKFPKLLLLVGEYAIDPDSGSIAVYAKSDGLYYRDSAGVEHSVAGGAGTTPVAIQLAASDESTALTTGTAKMTFRLPYAFTLTEARASLSAASTSGAVTVDVNMSGSSIFSTPLSIDASEKTSTSASTPAVILTTAMLDDAEMTIDIDAAGTGAKGLKITLLGTKP